MPFISRTNLKVLNARSAELNRTSNELERLRKELQPTELAPVHTWKVFLKNGDKITVKATRWGNAQQTRWDSWSYGYPDTGTQTILSDYAFYNGKQLVAEFQKEHVIAVTKKEQDN